MTQHNLENRLVRIAADWPMPSIVDAVMTRVEALRLEPARRRPRRGRQLALAASAAAAFVAWAAWLLAMSTPRTLQAQVQQAIAEAGAAHVTIVTADSNGARRQGEIWYSRGLGIRVESPDEIILDDGKQQLSWRPDVESGEVIVSRRTSTDAISMISESFQMETIPSGWNRTRDPQFDRDVNGVACQGFVVTPPAPNSFRLIVLADGQERIVRMREERQANGQWESGREVSIEYDAPIPPEKFVADFPAGARIVDAERLLEERFPLERALATTVASGIQFAIHDLQRVEGDLFFVLSSVRGTPEYLQQHPPKRRRMNLQLTLLDVAKQPDSCGNGVDCNRATLAAAESNGVHYMWWLAVRRRYYSVDDGVETPRFESPSLEIEPGRVRIPLEASLLIPDVSYVTAAAEVDLPTERQAKSLVKIAGQARHDVLTIRQDVGSSVTMRGGIKNDVMANLQPGDVTDVEYGQAIAEQLQWLHSLDKVSWPPQTFEAPK